MAETVTLLWLRRDLRLADNPALVEAARRGVVLPVYILDEGEERPLGAAARWWLRAALIDLTRSFARRGARLVLRRGEPLGILLDLARRTKADCVAFSRGCGAEAARDDEIVKAMEERGIEGRAYNANLLFEPKAVRTKTGGYYKVFTPFSKACFAAAPPAKPLSVPTRIRGIEGVPSDDIDMWSLTPRGADWVASLSGRWKTGEASAYSCLQAFLEKGLANYHQARDRPDLAGTSFLSPYLAFGQIGPRQIWHATLCAMNAQKGSDQGGYKFLAELLWREFAYHLLEARPDMTRLPFDPSFSRFSWREDPAALRSWQKGMTGYPIVDAGMRQLWREGWLHGRVRMIVASFLTKDLLLPWQEGEKWFWDTLVDADPANNPVNWQWVAGCGADPAPFFRIFNPVLQGRKFDPNGDYVRRYVPELAEIKGGAVHEPWLLKRGFDYPEPLVDHALARKRALEVLKRLKNGRS